MTVGTGVADIGRFVKVRAVLLGKIRAVPVTVAAERTVRASRGKAAVTKERGVTGSTVAAGVEGAPEATGALKFEMIANFPGDSGAVFVDCKGNLFERFLFSQHSGNGAAVIISQMLFSHKSLPP